MKSTGKAIAAGRLLDEPLSPLDRAHRERLRLAFSTLSLGEVQLLLLGLWIIGEENRVDPRQIAEYGWLLAELNAAAQGTLGHLLANTGAIAGVSTEAEETPR